MTKEEKPSNHYIDNKLFCSHMIDWKNKVNEANDCGEERPPVTEYIAKCFLQIAEHLSYRPNFVNYPYRDEMVGDGIENCLMYAHNFDPEKSKNPFSYFTQIIYYAFLRRIEKEKKQNYIKYKMLERMEDRVIQSWYKKNYFDDNEASVQDMLNKHFQLNEQDIKKFEPKKKKTKKSLEDKSSENSLDK